MSFQSVLPNQFRCLFVNETPFLDVRAPVEFSKGTFPTAFNFPILNTQEREQVGLCYKKHGQNAAIALGYQLISGEVKDQRIKDWSEFVINNPDAHLYCWRGGMRSNFAQQALDHAGIEVPLIAGGYKALRRVLIDELDNVCVDTPLIIVGGKTGTAKTVLVNELVTGVDLEGLAHHRGSSFGRRVKQPPCQVDFENQLGIEVLKRRDRYPGAPIFLEDEGRNVGPLAIPLNFWRSMTTAVRVVIDMPLEFRVQRILQEYVLDMTKEHLAADSENGFENYRQALLMSLNRIQKRLGGLRYSVLQSRLSAAIDEQEHTGCTTNFEGCIAQLLEEYYDPMYTYQMEKKQSQMIFRGSYDEVRDWAQGQLQRVY